MKEMKNKEKHIYSRLLEFRQSYPGSSTGIFGVDQVLRKNS